MKKLNIFIAALFLTLSSVAQMDTKYPDGLKVGDKAPAFTAKDQQGTTIDLKKMLKKGEVVVVFYRGQWCPYCNKQLSKINDSLSFIMAKGAMVIAVTPETAENIKTTINKTKATYPIIEDKGMNIMKDYKVNFAVDEKTVTMYKKYGIDFNKANGENGANLPVPATYIIGKDGKIKYTFFNPDYKARPSIKDIVDNL